MLFPLGDNRYLMVRDGKAAVEVHEGMVMNSPSRAEGDSFLSTTFTTITGFDVKREADDTMDAGSNGEGEQATPEEAYKERDSTERGPAEEGEPGPLDDGNYSKSVSFLDLNDETRSHDTSWLECTKLEETKADYSAYYDDGEDDNEECEDENDFLLCLANKIEGCPTDGSGSSPSSPCHSTAGR